MADGEDGEWPGPGTYSCGFVRYRCVADDSLEGRPQNGRTVDTNGGDSRDTFMSDEVGGLGFTSATLCSVSATDAGTTMTGR